MTYVPPEVQRILQQRGIRDEEVFPTPVILEAQPTLVGYYRLLTGVGKKAFYRGPTGMVPFAKMENDGILLEETKKLLPDFCVAMSDVLAELVNQITSTLEHRDIHELQLLTLGSNFYGSANSAIGRAATRTVLDAIAAALGEMVTNRSERELKVVTPNGRMLSVVLASDPDVAIKETIGSNTQNVLAIEIKGGSDAANVYNRGGEAEKSHQGAKQAGYLECWTVIHMSGIDTDKLKRGSPSTDVWFDTAQIVGQQGSDWEELRARIRRIAGMDDS